MTSVFFAYSLASYAIKHERSVEGVAYYLGAIVVCIGLGYISWLAYGRMNSGNFLRFYFLSAFALGMQFFLSDSMDPQGFIRRFIGWMSGIRNPKQVSEL